MIKKITSFILPLLISFLLGWILCYLLRQPKVVTITQDKIITNTITKNIKDMTDEDKNNDLYCFYTGIPTLDIKQIKDDEYEQSASLCARQWKRQTKIESVSKAYRNMIIVGTFFDSEMKLGINTQYYRFYGRLGFGGGLSWAQGYGSINVGLSFLW